MNAPLRMKSFPRSLHRHRARPLSRRRFLRGAGVALSLPLLDSMLPPFARAAVAPRRSRPARSRAGCSASATISACCPNLSSRQARGRDYAPSPYLELLKEHRNDFTVFSGVSHPERRRRASGGHLLPHRRAASGQQFVPQHHLARPVHRRAHRHAHAVPVAHARRQRRGRSLSWTGTGVAIPPEESARPTCSTSFSCKARPSRSQAQIRKLDTGRSILDAVADQAKELAAQRRRARSRPARSVFHQRPRSRAAPAGVARLGAQAEAGRQASPRRSIPPVPRNTWKR